MSISNGLHHRHRDDDATDDDDDRESHDDARYQPISAFDDDGSAPSSDSDEHAAAVPSPIGSNGGAFHIQNPSPGVFFLDAEGVLSALDLNDLPVDNAGGGAEEEAADEEAEEEEERVRQLEASISRAFSEDERRRSTPLTPDNAAMVVDAMRGVAFHGIPPEWANQVPEDQWVDRLRRLRG